MVAGGRWRLFRQEGGRSAGPSPLIYILLFAICVAIGNWSGWRYGAVVLWPANGVLVAALLQLHRRQALTVLAACFGINLLGNIVRADPAHLVALNAVLNAGEAVACACLARRFCGAALDMRRPARLARFVLIAAVPVVAVSAVIGIAAMQIPPADWPVSLFTWFMVETLGLLIATPTLLLIARRHRFDGGEPAPAGEKLALFALLAGLSGAVFAQSGAPVLFLVFLPLLLIAFRLPPAWSALAVLTVAVIASGATLNGFGPITLSTWGPQDFPNAQILPALRYLPVFHLFMTAVLCVAFVSSTTLTERRRLELRLKARTEAALAARARAEAAAEAKSRFLSMMSHEMRTPLNGVSGFADLLAARPGLDPIVREQVDQIRRASRALGALVDDVLDVARGEIDLVSSPFEIGELIEDVVQRVEEPARAKGLPIVCTLQAPAGVRLMGDAARVRQLLHHLLANAVKFTAEGQVELAAAVDEGGVVFAVSDTGPGLPDHLMQDLFEAFVQADASVRRRHEGAGLGLALCRSLVALMGGDIVAENRSGGGAVFRVRLPLQRVETPAAITPEPVGGPADAGRAPRILVVDDHPTNREVAALMLSAAGCEVCIACDGVEAVEAATTGAPDLILMDVRMPRMDGLEATRLIRSAEGPAAMVPIVAMTADAMPEDVTRCLAAGMNAHLAKPVTQVQLMTTVVRWLGEEADAGADRAAA